VRTIAIWMRNLPSERGEDAAAGAAAGAGADVLAVTVLPPPRTSVLLDQALVAGRGGDRAGSIDAVVAAGGVGCCSLEEEPPPNSDEKALPKLQPLDSLGAAEGDPSSESPPAEAVRVPAEGIAGATGSPVSLRPASW
jgi:hypothetical protein